MLNYFELKYHICIKTNALGYAISEVLSQMTSNQSSSNHVICKNHFDFLKSEISQWHLIVFFSKKMISVEMRYKTHN